MRLPSLRARAATPGTVGPGRWALPIRHRLSLLLGTLLAVILALSLAVTYRVLVRDAESAAYERLANAAREVAATAAQAAEARLSVVREVAGHPVLREALLRDTAPDSSSLQAVLEVLGGAGSPDGDGPPVELWRPDGRPIAWTAQPHADAARPVPPDGAAVASTRLYEEAGGVYSWTIAPVRAAGRTLGYVARQLPIGGPSDAERALGDLTGEAVSIHLRNADGSLWARHPGKPVEAPARGGASPAAGLSHEWPDAGRMLAAESAVPGAPLVVVVETPARLVHARARAAVSSLALFSLLLTFAGAVAASLVGRHITRPLTHLTRAAEAIRAGDYSRRVEVGGTDELGRLASSFNQMANEVESTRRELMSRIDEAQRAQRESEQLRSVAEEAREEAEQANRAKGDFLTVMSHELRTPLNAIAGYTELMDLGVYGQVTDDQRDALRRIARNQAHLLTLIDDVLNYAKLDAGKVRYTLTVVPVEKALSELELFLEPQMTAGGLHLVRRRSDPSVAVRADPDKLQQILLNLLSNAIKFTAPGGTITLCSAPAAGIVRIGVLDTGIGISPARLDAIFDPFFQGHREPGRPVEGVGLGLAISRDLARGMEGDLTVTSELGAGSAFTLVLPRAWRKSPASSYGSVHEAGSPRAAAEATSPDAPVG